MLAVAVAFFMTRMVPAGSTLSLSLLVAAAVVLDFGVSANLTLGQRAIFSLRAEDRSRLNGLYLATLFAGGAIGSAVGGWVYAQGGWPLAAWVGAALPVMALIYFSLSTVDEVRKARTVRPDICAP
jgi:predicted MFS family arabinose efflux permease